MREDEAVDWAQRSLDFAFECGASAATLIPTRGGQRRDGSAGLSLRAAHRSRRSKRLPGIWPRLREGRVFADLWDLRRFSTCDACYDARAAPIAADESPADVLATGGMRRSAGERGLRSRRRRVGLCRLAAGHDRARLGKSVILLERGKHPRFAIGESTTPLSNLLLEELAARYDLPNLLPLCKWGTWRQTHPELACGLKRGFTFYRHQPGREPRRDDQLLVAASPRDAIADTHWYRADVDSFFVGEAQRAGVDYRDEVRWKARASGTAESPSKANGLPSPRASWSMLRDRAASCIAPWRCPSSRCRICRRRKRSTRISRTSGRLDKMDNPPYPVDDAAVHHIFDGGWIWVLRFANGITSAGAAASFSLGEGEAAWRRLVDRFPAIRRQFARPRR
jgi:hypothetical protein